jgi:hypothetical protein
LKDFGRQYKYFFNGLGQYVFGKDTCYLASSDNIGFLHDVKQAYPKAEFFVSGFKNYSS